MGCARTGRRLPEKDYLVDLVPNETSVPPESRDETIPKEPQKEETTSKAGLKSEKLQEEKLQEQNERVESKSNDPDAGQTKEENVQLPVTETKSKIDSIKTRESGNNKEESKPAIPANPIVNKSIQGVKGQTPGRESTPSRLLRPGFKPSFDLDEAVAALDSPGMSTGMKGHRRKSSLVSFFDLDLG